MADVSRRTILAAMGAAFAGSAQAARPKGYLVENTLHMFAEDTTRFPLAPNATYKPTPNSLDKYIAFVKEVGLSHTVLVQPEPYQDDESYIEYCFTREPSPGYFKATCLYDPIDPATPSRIEALARKNPGRIVGMRMHEMGVADAAYTTSGAIKNRDPKNPAMKNTMKKLGDLDMILQVQLVPYQAKALGALASGFRNVAVLIDHFGLVARGTPEEYDDVVALSKQPQFYMKISQLPSNSKPMVKRVFDAFGPDRLVWGSFGSNLEAFNKIVAQIDDVFDFASENDRSKIRGGNAMKLFKFQA
jgi:predicted TIM-barrel fold metal-dependent hydrolase